MGPGDLHPTRSHAPSRTRPPAPQVHFPYDFATAGPWRFCFRKNGTLYRPQTDILVPGLRDFVPPAPLYGKENFTLELRGYGLSGNDSIAAVRADQGPCAPNTTEGFEFRCGAQGAQGMASRPPAAHAPAGGRSLVRERPHAIPRVGGVRGRLGMGEVWNGKTWHNRSVPNCAAVFLAPKPCF